MQQKLFYILAATSILRNIEYNYVLHCLYFTFWKINIFISLNWLIIHSVDLQFSFKFDSRVPKSAVTCVNVFQICMWVCSWERLTRSCRKHSTSILVRSGILFMQGEQVGYRYQPLRTRVSMKLIQSWRVLLQIDDLCVFAGVACVVLIQSSSRPAPNYRRCTGIRVDRFPREAWKKETLMCCINDR